MDGVRAADRLRRRLGKPDVVDLSGVDQLRHRADGLLDRHVRIDAVLVVEVDVVDAEPPQRAVDRSAHVLGGAVDGADRRHVARNGVVKPAPELGRDHVFVAVAPYGPPH